MERNVPKLRFKGFNDEWKKVNFSKCVNIKTGQVSPLEEPYCNMPHIGPGNMEKFTGRLLEYNTAKEDNQISGKFLFDENDVIYGKINPQLGKVVLPGFVGLCSADAYPLSVNKEYLNNYFLYLYIQTQKFMKYTVSVSMRSGMPKINRDELNEFIFKLPSLQEQERIANFLTKVDKIIEKQDEKVKNLEKYKKGMMQKIFSQEIRFKDENGEAYPEWDKRRIGDYIIEYTEKTTINNQYPVLTSSREGLMLQSDYFKDRQVTTDDNIGYFVLPYGYITFRSRSDDGIFVFNENKIIEKGIVSYFYPVFTFKNQLNNYYGITYMNNYLKKDILKEIVGTSQLVLSINKLKNLKILYPCIEEQNKIANFLSKIDLIIDKEKDNLKQLKQWKKGLLQQMFV